MSMPNSHPNSRPESTSPASQSRSRFDKPIAAPYPGLRPFEPHESAIFFGRDEHVAEMLTVLEDHRFLAVVGPSGGGKSSLVLAGLLPALRRGELLTARSPDWRFVTLRPGDDPFGNLARAAQEFLATKTSSTDASNGSDTLCFHDGDAELTELLLRGSPRGFVQTLKDAAVPPPTNVLLLVDQFEELFRFRAPEQAGTEAAAAKRRNDAAAFVQLLLATAKQSERPVHVLLTMRSDFLGDCDIFDGLPQAINAGQYLTPRLNWRQLEQAIVGPPALPQFGGAVDASVVQRITNDIGTQRDELPVVQHALFRAWLQSGDRPSSESKRTLTIADYHDVGGIREALSREADRALEECRALGSERIVERVFRALVQRGANGQRVRRPVTLGQLVDETGSELDEIRSVVEAFRRPDRSFLVPAISAVPHLEANTRIDISHESLIRQWGSLSRWLLNEEESESRFRRLVEAERAHRLGEGDLLAEIELNRLQGWWDAEQPRQAWMNRYEAPQVGPGAEASFARVDRYLRASRDALEKERAEERRRAEEERERKERELKRAQAHAETISRWLSGVVVVALIAIGLGAWASIKRAEANRFEKEARKATQEANRNLADANWTLAFSERDQLHDPIPAAWHFLRAAELSEKASISEHRNSALLAIAGVADLPIATFVIEGPTILGVRLSHDSSRVLSWSTDGVARVWDVSTNRVIHSWKHDGGVIDGTFHQNEARLLTRSEDITVNLWDSNNSSPHLIDKTGQVIEGAVFSTDGSGLLTWGLNGTLKLYGADLDMPLQVWEHGQAVTGALFTGNGLHALSWSSDGTIRLWNAERDEPLHILSNGEPMAGVSVSTDERRLLTWTKDGVVRLWDTNETSPIHIVSHEHSGVELIGATISPNGSHLVSYSSDGSVRLWRASEDRPLRTWKHVPKLAGFAGASFNRDGSQVLTWGGDGTARLWDTANEVPLHTFKHENSLLGMTHAAISHSGYYVITLDSEGCSRLWNTGSRSIIREWRHDLGGTSARLGRDSNRVLIWSRDGVMRLWTTTDSPPIRTWKHRALINGARFDRDESNVLTWGQDGSVQLWNVKKDNSIGIWFHDKSDSGAIGAVFDKEERHVLSWGDDGTARLWNTHENAPLRIWKHDSSVIGGMFSPDGTHVLTWSYDGSTRLWAKNSDSAISSWKTCQFPHLYHGAVFSLNGSRVLSWSSDGHVRLLDVNREPPLRTWAHDASDLGVYGARFSRDESHVLTWSNDGTARLWHTEQDLAVQTWRHDLSDGGVVGAVFSESEAKVLTWSEDHTARLWEKLRAEPLRNWRHDQPVHGGVFTRDETRVLTWGEDGSVRLWDTSEDQPLRTWHHLSPVNSAELSHDEARLLTCSEDGTVRLWDVSVDESIPLSERRLELEVRTATTLDDNGHVRRLTFKEWEPKSEKLAKLRAGRR